MGPNNPTKFQIDTTLLTPSKIEGSVTECASSPITFLLSRFLYGNFIIEVKTPTKTNLHLILNSMLRVQFEAGGDLVALVTTIVANKDLLLERQIRITARQLKFRT
jgi:hypothetical protein